MLITLAGLYYSAPITFFTILLICSMINRYYEIKEFTDSLKEYLES